MCPPSAQSKVVNAMDPPSGDQAGAYSNAGKSSGVSRRGSPPEASRSQSLPTASKTIVCPSGDAVGHRRNLASKESSGMLRVLWAISEMVRSTRALKGMVPTSPLAGSSTRMPPPWDR